MENTHLRNIMLLRTLASGFTAVGFRDYPIISAFLILFVYDVLDCNRFMDYPGCGGPEYQRVDKIVDSITGAFFLLTVRLPQDMLNILWVLWAFRVIGVMRFLNTGDQNELIYFPNLFDFAAFYFAVRYHYTHVPVNQYDWIFILGVLLPLKLIQENKLHGN